LAVPKAALADVAAASGPLTSQQADGEQKMCQVILRGYVNVALLDKVLLKGILADYSRQTYFAMLRVNHHDCIKMARQ
jgi:hypothetical protein